MNFDTTPDNALSQFIDHHAFLSVLASAPLRLRGSLHRRDAETDRKKGGARGPSFDNHIQIGLEVELQTQLDFARSVGLALDIAEIATVEVVVYASELRVVESIERFSAELQLGTFPHLVQ